MNTTRNGTSVSLTVLAVLGVIAALYLGSELLVPIATAGMLSVALRPLVRGMKQKVGLPAPAGATVVVLGIMGLIGVGVWLMAEPVKGWVDRAPETLQKARGKVEQLRRPIEKATELASQAGLSGEAATTRPTSGPTTREAEQGDTPEAGGVRGGRGGGLPSEGAASEGKLAAALGTTRQVLWGIVEVLLLLWLLLASDNLFYKKLLKVLPRVREKQIAAESVDEVETAVLRYLWVSFLLSAGEAVAVGLMMWVLGMPAPLVWALAALVLEFVPYLGAIVMTVTMTLTAAATMDETWRIVAVPLSYLTISALQNNVASPYLYGNHLKMNPVAVLIAVMFWWFVWGVPGAFLAVPIVAMIKIIADRTEGWKAVGEFLGD